MKLPWIDLLLIAVIVTGAIFTWRSANQYSAIRAEHARLKEKVDELPITDPGKIYVRAIQTNDPLSFAWRVYFPKNYDMRIHHRHGRSMGVNMEAVNDVFRVRLRETDGQLYLYEKFHNSSGLSGLPAEVRDFMRGRWNEVEVEQIGAKELEVLDPVGEYVWLRVKMNETLQKEAAEKLNAGMKEQYVPVILEYRIGEPVAP